MTPILYIHVGLPKTGTTSIQQYFLDNRRALLDYGVLYPLTGLHGPGHLRIATYYLNADTREKFARSNLLTESATSEQELSSLLREIEGLNQSIHSVLLSAESFQGADPGSIETLVKQYQPYFKIKVIMYLRRQDHLAESFWAQSHIVRYPMPNPNVLLDPQNRALDLYGHVKKWSDGVGAQNMLLREYPESTNGAELLHGFKELLSVDTIRLQNIPKKLNERLSREVLEYIMHHTNWVYASGKYFARIDLLQKYSRLFPTEQKYGKYFSPPQRMKILDNHFLGNKQISEEHFSGWLFLDCPAIDPNEHWEYFPGLSNEKILHIRAYLNQYV